MTEGSSSLTARFAPCRRVPALPSDSTPVLCSLSLFVLLRLRLCLFDFGLSSSETLVNPWSPIQGIGCKDGSVRVFDMYIRKCSRVIRLHLMFLWVSMKPLVLPTMLSPLGNACSRMDLTAVHDIFALNKLQRRRGCIERLAAVAVSMKEKASAQDPIVVS